MIGFVLLAGIFGGRVELRSSSAKVAGPQAQAMHAAQAATGEAEQLQAAFIRIAQQAGPSVVSISTEQIERVRQYFRVHPFFGFGGSEEPFEELFRQFYGDVPERSLKRFGLGSGVIIDPQGYVLTNEHVVADAEKITVTLADGREFIGTVKGKDARSDLAVIKIDATQLVATTLGDSSTVKTGQWAVALGHPFGLGVGSPSAHALGAEPTLTVGVISALNRQLPRASRYDRDYSGLIQTDAAINRGNSGGPLLNLQGEVIGINVAILTSSQGFEGIGFAIPVNKAKSILEQLIEGKQVVYGWLGIQIQDIDEEIADFYHLENREGVLVYQVLPESPASRAGTKDGDIVKAFDGVPIRHTRELIDRVSATKAGKRVRMDILREGKRQTLQVEIGERPLDVDRVGGGEAQVWNGLRVTAVTPQMLERFTLPPGTAGVIVIDVEPDSPADEAGLQPGDVINQINQARIESLDDYRSAIASATGKALVRTNRGYVVIKAGG